MPGRAEPEPPGESSREEYSAAEGRGSAGRPVKAGKPCSLAAGALHAPLKLLLTGSPTSALAPQITEHLLPAALWCPEDLRLLCTKIGSKPAVIQAVRKSPGSVAYPRLCHIPLKRLNISRLLDLGRAPCWTQAAGYFLCFLGTLWAATGPWP